MLPVLALHILLALIVPLAHRRLGPRCFLLGALAPAAACAWALMHAPSILSGTVVEQSLAWAPSLGFELQFAVDGFSLLMVGLVGGIGVLVFTYSATYFGDSPGVGRLAGLLVAFAGAMLGLVTTDNLLAIFLFWELTSVTSYLLIGFDDRSAAARAAALRAMLVTSAGGLLMLGGIVLLWGGSGTLSLSEILTLSLRGPLTEAALCLILLGAFTKSAQVPFHYWLPGAMAAPTPVSAYLHSATMVKAGVYLVARLAPAFAELWWWRPLVVSVGLITLLVGGWRALAQNDAKLLLAHGTTSQLGFLMVLLGVGIEEASLAGLAMLLAHAAFKAALFLAVGAVDKATGTRDITRLSGLYRKLPVAFGATLAAAASMAGVPPLFGFVAKEAAFESLLQRGAGLSRYVALFTLVLGAAVTFAYSARLVWGLFASKPSMQEAQVPTGPGRGSKFGLLAPSAGLAFLGILFGLWPSGLTELLTAAGHALWPGMHVQPLALWHGLNLALGLSAAAVGGGLVLWKARARLEEFQSRRFGRQDAAAMHDRGYVALLSAAKWLTGRVQRGSLPMYLMVILAATVLAPGGFLMFEVRPPDFAGLLDRPLELTMSLLMIGAALVATQMHERLAAVVAVSFVGYGVAFLFVSHGAPDLALTQVLVETLLLVLFVLVLRRFPREFPRTITRVWEGPRIVVAAAMGLLMTGFVLATSTAHTAAPVSEEMLARSLPEGAGRNVVNVILVDFRAFDTFGEILVLTVAALGVLGLVRAARRDPLARMKSSARPTAHPPSPILDGAVRALFHTVLLYSVVLLLTGHDRPGGGFIGGLLGGSAFILVYLAGGEPRVRRAEPHFPETIMGAGVVLAAVSGVASWLRTGSFFKSVWLELALPGMDPLKVGSVLLFDVGVYLVVVGLVVAILRSAGRGEEVGAP